MDVAIRPQMGQVAAASGGLPLELAHFAEIEPRLAALRNALGSQALSEYTFSNLYFFRREHAYRYLPGPYPCVAGLTYDGARHLLPLFDLRSVEPAALAGILRGHDSFFPVPAAVFSGLDAQWFCAEALPDDADYLYAAARFREYRGDMLRKKRNLMQQLLASHRVEAFPLEPARLADAHKVLARWMADKRKLPGAADEAACGEALALAGRFGLDGMIFYADGVAAGLLLAQTLAPGVAAMRFAKGIDAYKGIYQYMFHHYCVAHSELDWINFEQDLGQPNFRQTKRSYQPHSLLDKCRVRLK